MALIPAPDERSHARERSNTARYRGPTWRDWLLLTIGLTFVLMALIILPRKPDVGIVTLAFFGSCFMVFLSNILRKFRFRRFRTVGIDVAGGVPIRPPRWRVLLLGGWLLILGAIMVRFGATYPMMFRLLGGFVAVVGAALLAGVPMGWLPRGYLQFDSEGLTIDHGRWRALIPWDQFADIREAELHDNPVMLISVDDVEAIVFEPPEIRPRALRAIASTQAWHGAHLMIMTSHYGIDLPVLTAAIARYANDRSARQDLGARALPEGEGPV